MSEPLPALRMGLDFMPSPVEDRPGLLIRDPLLYSDQVLIVPPPLVPLLALFDGQHDELDLQAALVRLTGELRVEPLLRHLVDTLRGGAFLHDPAFERKRAEREAAFAAAAARGPAHAGSAYPEAEAELRETLLRYLSADGAGRAPTPRPLAIAAPHVSPEGGYRSYAAAYACLGPADAGRTALILGTSHYGAPDRFGLTRKPFATPLGEVPPELDLVDALAAQGGAAVTMEDYCHAVEHSIEFQVVFLRQVLGEGLRIVPVLCGPFATDRPWPEDDAGVARFLEALRDLVARVGDRLLVVLGIDMAHVGRRYGDATVARADEGPLREVAARDQERIARALAGDAPGFWALVRGEDGAGDDLNWCGAAPLYAFLRAAPGLEGRLLRYEQWNIDEESVVSFAGLAFTPAARRA
jgi:AmmeMemoRadiSam system protein B